MIKTIASLLLFSAVSFSAVPGAKRTLLLECNVTSGEFQAVNIYQQDKQLILSALNNHGSTNEYTLPVKQWNEQKISVPCAYTKGRLCGHVYLDRGDWVYRLGSMGFYSIGICR